MRGTNSNEGYHRNFRRILSTYTASPMLVQQCLLLFNTRWNLRRSLVYNGLDEQLKGVSDYANIEKVHIMHTKVSFVIMKLTYVHNQKHPPLFKIFGTAPFVNWASFLDFADTGERGGFASNVVPENLEESLSSDIEDINIDMFHQALQYESGEKKMTRSALGFQTLVAIESQCTPVDTVEEKEKFTLMLSNYTPLNANTIRNIDDFVKDWNMDVIAKKERNIYLKHSRHLEQYYKDLMRSAGTRAAMAPARRQADQLRASLQLPKMSKFKNII
jgi:hypothetical protein